MRAAAIILPFVAGVLLTIFLALVLRPPHLLPAPAVPMPEPAPLHLPLHLPLVPTANALAALGDGTVVLAQGERLFHLRSTGTGLALSGAYALVRDRQRHATDAPQRSAHGWYLDDLGRAGERALAAAQEGFLRETRSGAVDAEANARAETWARALLEAGDATMLLEALRDRRYGTRRAAAFVLGEAGYAEARPALEEVLTEKTGDGAERARRLIERLATAPPSAPKRP